MIQISKVLKQVPIFRMLGKESIDFIIDRLKFKTFDNNETICKIGDPGDEMFIIISGKVKICIYDDNGENEQVVASLGSGDYFGEMALLTGETRSASVIATESCEMFVLQKNDFDVILEKYPSISLSMGKIVSQRLKETLKKASQRSTGETISVSQHGPSGNLKDVPLVDLIRFCESNSLTGSMTLNHAEKKGVFEFKSGEIQKISLSGKKDDEALDTMLQWTEGEFTIDVKPLSLVKEETKEKEQTTAKHILIVNNSLVVRKVIERAFKGLGYEVSSAQNIAAAMDLMAKSAPDIIISDIKLPDGNGLEFIGKARDVGEVPFIFITDSTLKGEFEDKLRSTSKAVLTKTHEVSEIVKLVENML